MKRFCYQLPSWPRAAVPSREFTSLAVHCSPMLAKVRNEVHGVDYFCFSCRWQFLCCITPNSTCANSWRFQLRRPACARATVPPGLDLLCNSLHLLALSLPEKHSSYLPFCKPSTPYLSKHLQEIMGMFSSGRPVIMRHLTNMLMSKGIEE